jgi:hypothetical protein
MSVTHVSQPPHSPPRLTHRNLKIKGQKSKGQPKTQNFWKEAAILFTISIVEERISSRLENDTLLLSLRGAPMNPDLLGRGNPVAQ